MMDGEPHWVIFVTIQFPILILAWSAQLYGWVYTIVCIMTASPWGIWPVGYLHCAPLIVFWYLHNVEVKMIYGQSQLLSVTHIFFSLLF